MLSFTKLDTGKTEKNTQSKLQHIAESQLRCLIIYCAGVFQLKFYKTKAVKNSTIIKSFIKFYCRNTSE
jgi:hypothetical protein